ncbi:MAG TPA: NifU family protein [Streptosporangiaceae bacterium]|nr:NifU family protein [Streptosporangiaceae bacterium]
MTELPWPPPAAELPWPPAAAGLTGQVVAALEKSLLPSIIARGAALRVAGVQDGIATLELTGSPGAVVPLAARIEAQIRAAVPGITGVRIVTPGDPAPPEAAATLAEQARRIIDREINPAIAAHRGRAVLVGAEDGWVRIRLDGGCQGCSLAEVTVRQGIEPLLRARLPGVVGVLDVTDHQAGTQPFFSPEKR